MRHKTLPNAASAREVEGRSRALGEPQALRKTDDFVTWSHIQSTVLCFSTGFMPTWLEQCLTPCPAQRRQHLWALPSQNKSTLSSQALLQTWFLICHTRSRYSHTLDCFKQCLHFLPACCISLWKMHLQGNVTAAAVCSAGIQAPTNTWPCR